MAGYMPNKPSFRPPPESWWNRKDLARPIVPSPDVSRRWSSWYERTVFWGLLSLGAGIGLTAVSVMKHDVRWLLWVAAPCFIGAFWIMAKDYVRGWFLAVVVALGGLVICTGLYCMYVWLGRSEEEKHRPRVMNVQKTRINKGDSAIFYLTKLAPSSTLRA